jgi:MoaA/NifB/PqqE/SkfB family radical SAM enzyme
MADRVRLYAEAPEFGAYSRFDAAAGVSRVIGESEFREALDRSGPPSSVEGGLVRRGGGAEIFLGEALAGRTRFPRRVYFQITRNCNLECPYCFIRSGKGLPEVPTDAAVAMAAYLGENGLMEVRLTGGEPTTHSGFFEILDAFRSSGVYVSVATNGLLSEEVSRGLAERDGLWIVCSIDGSRRTHERYRPGSFDAIMRNLKGLKRARPDIRLRLTTVLTRRNSGELGDIADIALELGAESVTVIPLRPQLRDASVRGEMLDASEFKLAIDAMVAAMDRTGVKMTTTLSLDAQGRMHGDPIVRNWGACAAGREATNLDFDAGRSSFLVYGCSYSPASDLDAPAAIRAPFLAGEFPVENPSRFGEIWRDDRAWAVFRDPGYKSSECRSCGYLLRKGCVGSCPIQNVDYAALAAEADLLDGLREQLERTAEWYCHKKTGV